MNRVPCQYAVVRFLPYAQTGEFANVGVVLACPERGYFGFRLLKPQTTKRIRGFFEKLDLAIYRNALGYMNNELQGLATFAKTSPERIGQIFMNFVQPRETLLRLGPTHVLMAESPEKALTELFARMVERNFADKAHHDKMLERSVRELLRRTNLRELYVEALIGEPDDLHLSVPFAHQHEGKVQIAIKPLDLLRGDANKVFDTGGRLLDRIHRLKKREQLPNELMVVVQEPPPLHGQPYRAAMEIQNDLRAAGVKVAHVGNAEAITAFAQAARLN